VLPFWWKIIQNTITTMKIASRAPMGPLSSCDAFAQVTR